MSRLLRACAPVPSRIGMSEICATKPFVADFRDHWPTKSIFCGIGFTRDKTILGQRGWAEANAQASIRREDLIAGRFLAVLVDDEKAEIFCDPMAQDTLYYWVSPGGKGAVVSNSLLALTGYLARSGVSLKLWKPAAFGFKYMHGGGLAAQLFQPQPPVEGIAILDRDCCLEISRADNTLTLRRPVEPAKLNPPGMLDVREALKTFLINACSRMKALSRIEGAITSCDLSGGRDSRIVFGLMLRSGIAPDKFAVFSQSSKPDDWAVASRVGEHYGVEILNRKQASDSRIDARSAVERWLYGAAGVYLPIYVSTGENDGRTFDYHGGNFVATAFARQSPETISGRLVSKLAARRVTKQAAEALSESFLSWFRHARLDIAAPQSMQAHYINFRSRFHYGRDWSTSHRTQRITPLIDRDLYTLYHQAGRPIENFYPDLLLAIDNFLAAEPFDKPSKAIPLHTLHASEFWGKPISFDADDLIAMKIYGDNNGMQEARGNKEGKKPRSKSIKEVLSDTLSDVGEAAMDSGVFSTEEMGRARAELTEAKKLSHDARTASHVLQIGALMKAMG